MLVFSRKKNECIVIGDDISIYVVEIRGDKVRLGIVAPREASVHRQEVFVAIHGVVPCQVPCDSEPVITVEISVDQLVNDLGATDAEVDRKVRFTNEGGVQKRRRHDGKD